MAFSLRATLENAHDDGIWSVSWSSSGQLLTGSCDETCRSHVVVDNTIKKVHEYRGHNLGITSVTTSATTAVSTSLDSHIRAWDLETGEEISDIDSGPLEAWTASISTDSSTLFTGTQNGCLNVWNMASRSRMQCLPTGSLSFVMSVACSPAGGHVACANADGAIFIFDSDSGKLLASLDSHAARVRALAFSADGTLLASGSDDAHVNLYDVGKRALAAVLAGHGSWVLGVSFSPDGALLASCGADRTVRLWSVANKVLVQTLVDAHEGQVWGVAFDPTNSKRLASVGEDKALKLWADA